MNKKSILSLVLAVLFVFSACGSTDLAQSESSSTEQSETEAEQPISTAGSSDMFTDKDMEIGYNEETSTWITLSGDNASSNSDTVQVSGSTVTITDAGTYILSGSLEDGMIIVNAEDTDKVQLVLKGVQITSSTSAAIYVLQADKVFITTASGTQNTLVNGGEYVAIDDNNIDGVIFSKSDLTLNGDGTLTISANAGHGIVSKDDLVITSGTYNITAASHGISGKDSVRIANGTYTIESGKDGIHAENTEDSSMGFLYVGGGTFDITADGDGMSASSYLQIENGTFTITSGEGSASVSTTNSTTEFGQSSSLQAETITTQDDTISQKGIKADGNISITSGTFNLDSVDDAIHAANEISIAAGEFNIASGDDAIHSDSSVVIEDGSFKISDCYEGVEGLSITVDGGTFDITSEDDGLNAGGGNDSSGFGVRMSQQDEFSTSSGGFITINNGSLTIVSTGDCIDSNGDLTINGGVLNLTCNGSGNTALDCDGSYTNNGGEITTNDGSENNPGQMGGMGKTGGKGQGHSGF